MGTHPIFESDFDCLTDNPQLTKKSKMRIERDIIDDIADKVTGCDDMWCPSETQLGEKWTPTMVGGISLTLDSDKTMDVVEKMWWLYLVQLVISILPSIIACLSKCCSNDDNRSEKRASVAGGSSSLSTFLIGLFGLLAIKFNCKELLTASTITAVISIILTVVYLLIMLILFAIGCTWVLASNAINVYLLYLAWPFCFNESLDDTMNKIESEIDTVTN